MYLRPRQGQQELGGLWSDALNIIEEGVGYVGEAEQAKGAKEAYEKSLAAQQAKGAKEAYEAGAQQQQKGTPDWVLPVAVGGGVLVLAMVLMRK